MSGRTAMALCCLAPGTLALGLLPAFVLAQERAAPAPAEELLWVLPESLKPMPRTETALQGGAGIALIASRGKEQVIVRNGAPGSSFGASDAIIGHNFVYTGRAISVTAEGVTVQLDENRRLGPYASVAEPSFDPSGRRFGFTAQALETLTLFNVIDGEVGPDGEAVSAVSFSDDGEHAFHAVLKGKSGFLVKDRRFYQKVDDVREVGTPVPNADGTRYLWPVKRGNKRYTAVIDSQEGPSYREISGIAFSADGQRLAYAAKGDDGRTAVIVDGKRSALDFDSIIEKPVFSRDSQHLAYAGWDRDAITIVHDGNVLGRIPTKRGINFVGELAIGPDGSTVVCVFGGGGFGYTWARVRGKEGRSKQRVYVNAKAGPEYDVYRIEDLTFSGGMTHFAYVVQGLNRGKDKDKSLVVMDGREGRLYDGIASGSLTVSDEAATFVARTGSRIVRVTAPLDTFSVVPETPR